MRSRNRAIRLVVGALGALAASLLAGCSAYEPFDDRGYLEKRLEERLPPDLAGRVDFPHHLEPDVREAVQQRLDPSGSERRRTNAVLDFIFGWLDLEYSLTPTRDASATFRSRQGNCLSFVNLFVGVGRLQRLNPFYVEVRDYQKWNYSDGVVVSRGHIVAGQMVDGKLSTYDFLPYTPKSYRDFEPIDDLTATAHHYNNLGAEALMAGDMATAERHLRVATALAPDFDRAANNLGVIYLRRGQAERAIELYRTGLERDPDNLALLSNLARAYQDEGREAEAEEILARLEDVNEANPFFFVYRGERVLAEGDPARALDYMRQALRADSEVPEVHIGLLKVYLAMGETQKARHHLERALRLDATHTEARRYAAMLDADAPGEAVPEPGG